MLSRLFRSRSAQRTSRTPPDCVIWAVGDIHGRSDLLDRLIQAIRADLSLCNVRRRVVVCLGDYVDRGLDSRGVLDQLCNLAADPALEVHFVKGNHEERMEAFLQDPGVGPSWCDYGGRETLISYGVNPPTMRGDADAWSRASQDLAEALPAHHRELLASQKLSASIGDYFFAHAGARPGIPLSSQSPDDLLWIRQPFLDHPALFEQVVVHGHTPTDAVHSDARRIGVDTGAYATNVLSAVRLEGQTRVQLQAMGRADRVTISTGPLTS
jgi:serine/threonine protein phosphatase 1